MLNVDFDPVPMARELDKVFAGSTPIDGCSRKRKSSRTANGSITIFLHGDTVVKRVCQWMILQVRPVSCQQTREWVFDDVVQHQLGILQPLKKEGNTSLSLERRSNHEHVLVDLMKREISGFPPTSSPVQSKATRVELASSTTAS
jgi:hypothetical protein